MNKKTILTIAVLFIGIVAVSAQSNGAGGGNGTDSGPTAAPSMNLLPTGFTWPTTGTTAEKIDAYNTAVRAYNKDNPSAPLGEIILGTAVLESSINKPEQQIRQQLDTER